MKETSFESFVIFNDYSCILKSNKCDAAGKIEKLLKAALGKGNYNLSCL